MKYLIALLFPLVWIGLWAQENNTPPKADDCPCCSADHRAFDFWLGSWEVFGPKGNLAGTNDIDLIQDKCILRENWKSAASPFTGTSYNFYDARSGQWVQTWVDNQGGSLQLHGGWNGTAMVMSGDPTRNRKGEIAVSRVTWTPNEDGTVRQLWEMSVDEGKTWSTVFDGLYRKKN